MNLFKDKNLGTNMPVDYRKIDICYNAEEIMNRAIPSNTSACLSHVINSKEREERFLKTQNMVNGHYSETCKTPVGW